MDERTRIGFDVPLTDFHLDARHFDPATADGRVKHAFTLSGPNSLDTTIEVFRNTGGLDLEQFFDRHLGFMRGGLEQTVRTTVGAEQWPAIWMRMPRQPGSYPQQAAILARGRLIVRVLCNDVDDRRASTVFARVLDSIEVPEDDR